MSSEIQAVRAAHRSASSPPPTAAGWASQVGYQKERNFTFHLIARAGAAVETVE